MLMLSLNLLIAQLTITGSSTICFLSTHAESLELRPVCSQKIYIYIFSSLMLDLDGLWEESDCLWMVVHPSRGRKCQSCVLTACGRILDFLLCWILNVHGKALWPWWDPEYLDLCSAWPWRHSCWFFELNLEHPRIYSDWLSESSDCHSLSVTSL